MPQRVADYFVIAGLDFTNPHSLRLPGENHNQGKLWFVYDSFLWLIDKINYNSKSCMVPHIVSIPLWHLTSHRSYGVMVSTQDSESCDPSSSLGRTFSFSLKLLPMISISGIFHTHPTFVGEICHVMITDQNAHYNEDDNGLYLGRRSRSRRTQWFEFISASLISIISIFSQIVIVSIGGNCHFRTGLKLFYPGAGWF